MRILFTLCLLALSLPLLAQHIELPTVEGSYLGLSMGPLRQARLATLPQGVLLRAGTFTITEQQLANTAKTLPPTVQPHFAKHRFFFLEQQAVRSLFLIEARQWAKEAGRDPKKDGDAATMNAYVQTISKKAAVTDAEVRAYYDANKHEFGGAPFDTVAKDLKAVLLAEKGEALLDAHIARISERTTVEVQADWLRTQAAIELDNPLDRARRSGKPVLVELGAKGCWGCEVMAPIIAEFQHAAGDRYLVLSIQVREEPVLAARYGIRPIPAQIFFNKEGKEYYRHVGVLSREEITAKLAELGVE